MKYLVKKAVLSLAIAASLAVTATPAEAQWGGRHSYRHHDDVGWALGAGLIGLAAGAAIASSHGYGYYGRPAYGGYYGRPAYGGYYPPYYRPYRAWAPRCFMERNWDYWGRPVWMRVCS